jgi:MFS family permease
MSLTAGALAWVAGSWLQDRAETQSKGSLTRRALRVVVGLILLAIGIAGSAVAVLLPEMPIAALVAAWAVAGLGMGLTYPASTLTALGLAPAGQEGNASASLQVAETIGVAVGTGAAGALFALAPRLAHPAADGLTWAFLLSFASAVIALPAAARLAPSKPALLAQPQPRWYAKDRQAEVARH